MTVFFFPLDTKILSTKWVANVFLNIEIIRMMSIVYFLLFSFYFHTSPIQASYFDFLTILDCPFYDLMVSMSMMAVWLLLVILYRW